MNVLMSLQPLLQSPHDAWNRCSQHFSDLRRRLPLWTQISAGIIVFLLVSAGLHSIFFGRGSVLHLRVQHGFASAEMAVFVDDDSVFTGKLTGVAKKKYVLFGNTMQGALTQEIPVSSGSHRIRVQLTSSDGRVQQDSITADFATNSDRTLLVNARRGNLDLEWVGNSAPTASDSAPASTGGGGLLNRYSTTIFMSIAGSIISALTGFALRELPGYLKSRQNVTKDVPQNS
jgi:hypothetical protein